MCQKASGQAFMAFAIFDIQELHWTRSLPAIFHSSNVAQRGFCSKCGTPLTYQLQSEEIAIATCTLDDPAMAPPTKQYGVESMVPWFSGTGGLPEITTDEDLGADLTANLIRYQHPDHET
jgi:hypothetical protein